MRYQRGNHKRKEPLCRTCDGETSLNKIQVTGNENPFIGTGTFTKNEKEL